MNTFSLQMVDNRGTVLTVTTGTYKELQELVDKLGGLGWKLFNSENAPLSGVTGTVTKAAPNKPANVPGCPHHPDVPMGHDKQNPGQYYCKGKVDGKWCGYKASKDGVVRGSILDKEDNPVWPDSNRDEIPF